MKNEVSIQYRQNLDAYNQWEQQKREDHEQAIRNLKKRERVQDRKANIKLLKAVGRVALKALVAGLIVWALLQTWTERIPR